MLFACSLSLIDCSNDSSEDITHDVNKNGAVELAITVAHIDSTHDVLTTTHKVWVHDCVYRTIQYHDTLPVLGTEHTVAENSDGDTQNVAVKKDYEIYITVK